MPRGTPGRKPRRARRARKRDVRVAEAAATSTAALPSEPAAERPWAPYRILLDAAPGLRTRSAAPLFQNAVAPFETAALPPPFLPVPVRETLAQRKMRARQEVFLSAFRRLGTLTAAALAVGIEARTHGYWRTESDEYRAAYERCRVEAVELLETEARRRALHGVDELILVAGRPVLVQDAPGAPARLLTKKVYSDQLLMFLLKANKPGKYRERFLDQPPRGGVQEGIAGDDLAAAGLEFDWERVSPTELETVRTILVKARGYADAGRSAFVGPHNNGQRGNGGPPAEGAGE